MMQAMLGGGSVSVPVPLAALVAELGGELVAGPTHLSRDAWGQTPIQRPSALAGSQSGDLVFYFSRDFESELELAKASAVLASANFLDRLKELPWVSDAVVWTHPDPYWAMAKLTEIFAPSLSTIAFVPQAKGKGPRGVPPRVHPSAVVHPTVRLGEGASVGPHCVIEEGVLIGEGSQLYPGCFIGPGVQIGADCVVFPNVVLYEHTKIGDRVRIHANTTVGSDGFGYAPEKSAGRVQGLQKIYHLGRVVIGNDAELGAGVTIDRGTFGETRVAAGAKLDNQVHLGHNTSVGSFSAIAGATCLAGRASVGRFVQIGGLTGVGNQVHIGDGAQVGALAMVTKDVPPGSTAVGNPQRDYRTHFKVHALLNKLLEERSQKLSGGSQS